MHAVGDIGVIVDWLCERQNFAADARSCLAVLHNQNRMVNDFRSSSWVTESKDSIVSRGVTTCAGMTAHTVILVQTRVGFLTGGRKESFRELPQDEQLIQLEEAYGRATVALTRARSLCVIMGPLDMKGLVGAATVVGSLMYGAGHVFRGVANVHLHDKLMQDSPSDSDFARKLSLNCALDAPDFPPPAIAEALEDYLDNCFKIRRLHLIIVDTWRPWRYNAEQIRAVTDQMWHLDDSPECQRVVPMRPGRRPVPPRCRRFVYGYALDHSEFPCYLVWPFRDRGGVHSGRHHLARLPGPHGGNLFPTFGAPTLLCRLCA